MLAMVVSLLGLVIGSAAFAYELWVRHPIISYFLTGLAAISGIATIAISTSEPLRTFLKAHATRRIEPFGPINLPTVLASIDSVLIGRLLVILLIQTKLDRSNEQVINEVNTERELLRETNEVLRQQKELIGSMMQLESNLPANFSVADVTLLTKELRSMPHFRFRIYRLLDEHINRLTDELTGVLKGGWMEGDRTADDATQRCGAPTWV